jgi:hypothetical protein
MLLPTTLSTGMGRYASSFLSVVFDVSFMYLIVKSMSQYMMLIGACSMT